MSKVFLLFFLVLGSVFCTNAQTGEDVFNVARHGKVSQMEVLYAQNPAQLDSVNSMGFTPLILACYRGNDEVAVYIASKTKKLNFNSDSGTALTASVFKGNYELVKKLLELGADPNIADANGTTPLFYAVDSENEAMVKLLLKYKADTTLKDGMEQSIFEHAIKTKNQTIINLLKN